MSKKRLNVDLEETEHKKLVEIGVKLYGMTNKSDIIRVLINELYALHIEKENGGG